MSKNVIYILIGLAVVAVIGMYLQSVVVSSLRPPDDNVVVPDTHHSSTGKVVKGVRGVR
jgi:hypothetical protein